MVCCLLVLECRTIISHVAITGPGGVHPFSSGASACYSGEHMKVIYPQSQGGAVAF